MPLKNHKRLHTINVLPLTTTARGERTIPQWRNWWEDKKSYASDQNKALIRTDKETCLESQTRDVHTVGCARRCGHNLHYPRRYSCPSIRLYHFKRAALAV